MRINLFSINLDDNDLIKRLKNKNDLFGPEDVLNILELLISNILHSIFFEDPDGYLYSIVITDYPNIKEEIQYIVNLEESFYNKHIGKFIKNIKHKILNDITVKFMIELKKIDWRKI